jgi:MSHA pilin protein MshC
MSSTTQCWAELGRRPNGRLLALSGAQRGFTLVELVTALVIIGIVSAYAMPRFFDNQSIVFSERGYADEVAAALRYAQRIATASRCPVRITVNAANYTAVQQNGAIQPATGCPAGAWTTQVRRMDGSNLSGAAPAGVVLAPAATVIVFQADGAAANAALNINGRFAINVDAFTGDVTVAP